MKKNSSPASSPSTTTAPPRKSAAFERILIEWQLQRAGQDADDQIGIDGKAQRGSAPHVKDEQKTPASFRKP